MKTIGILAPGVLCRALASPAPAAAPLAVGKGRK
jgi:hypothetical protein